MAQAAHKTDQEYWRPADPAMAHLAHPEQVICPFCGEESSGEARFCHACGSELKQHPAPAPKSMSFLLNIEHLASRLELSLASLVFAILGLTCMIGAVATSLVYRADTLVDWQAVQVWRIEWLLGACAALLAAILLKKSAT